MRDFDGHIVFIPWVHIFLLACGVIIPTGLEHLAYVFRFSVVKSINIGSHYLAIQCCMFLTHQTASQEYIWSKCSIEHFA